jgi:uncharacterized protein
MTKDGDQARRLYELGAAHGEALGARFLAQMYWSGDGLARDPVRAAHWYERAAALGDPEAMDALAELYRDGEGVGTDRGIARRWTRAAAARRAEMPPGITVLQVVRTTKP